MIWVLIAVSIFLILIGLYVGMKKAMITLGIDSIKQRKEHSSKEWKEEKAVVPLNNFRVETDVKWCPSTDEIFYRNPKEGGMFSKDWIEVNEYSDLYQKLLSNFQRKYQKNPRPKQGRRWTSFER